MKLNLVGPFIVNAPYGTEIAFAKGLRREGHEVAEVDPNIDRNLTGLDERADATLVFKSCVGCEPALTRMGRQPIIVYQPDDARFSRIREMMLMMRQYSDLFLSFDGHGAQTALTMGYRVAEALPVTADDELYCPSPEPIERDIDVSFIGNMMDPVAHRSRMHMLKRVQRAADTHGWRTHFEVSPDVPHIVDVYRRSKVVINHATDVGQPFGTGYGLQCRHFEVGMTRTCLLSNRLLSGENIGFAEFTSDENLISRLWFLLNDPNAEYPDAEPWRYYADQLYYNIMTNHRPEHRARQLVQFIERNI